MRRRTDQISEITVRLARPSSLAVCAVTALGLGATCLAAPVAAEPARAPGAVVLLSQQTQAASSAPESVDAAITLAAVGGLSADLSFQANLDPAATAASPGWVDLGAATELNGGYGILRWDGRLAGEALSNTRVALRAAATSPGGTAYDVRNDVLVGGPEDPLAPIALTQNENPDTSEMNDAATTVGYFTQPYADSGRTAPVASVRGVSRATSGTVDLSWYDAETGTFAGHQDVSLTPANLKLSDGSGGGTPSSAFGGEFRGEVDLTGFDLGAPLALAAAHDTDDVAVVDLVEELPEQIGAEADPVPEGSPTAPVTVVVSRGANPEERRVAGVEVRRESDGALVGYTDGAGEVVAQQPTGTNERYYANLTDVDAYEAGTDLLTNAVTTTTYVQETGSTDSFVPRGSALDVDEYRVGDIVVEAFDQYGAPMREGTHPVEYRVYPVDSTPSAVQEATVVGDDGLSPIPLPALPDEDTEWSVEYRRTGTTDGWSGRTVTTGRATVEVPRRLSAASGGRIDASAVLTVAGQPLVGRTVRAVYRRGVEAVPGTEADAGLPTAGGRLTLRSTLTTDESGAVPLAILDPAERGRPTEYGGKLVLTLASSRASATSATQFGSGRGTAVVRLTGRSRGGRPDVIKVVGPTTLAGERVKLYAKKGRRNALVGSKRLNRTGDVARLSVRDLNGSRPTLYVAKVVSSKRAQASTSKKLRLR
ncbi:MAG: hypothetical protein CMH83_07735 [Nocardioides sp.]|nr:hypothetical protein [Nocardioides sp.]